MQALISQEVCPHKKVQLVREKMNVVDGEKELHTMVETAYKHIVAESMEEYVEVEFQVVKIGEVVQALKY